MKRFTLILLITLFTTTLSAQMMRQNLSGSLQINWHKTGWFIDGNAGIRALGETSNLATNGLGLSGNAGLGYFFNETFALKGRLDYNQFKASYGDKIDRSGSASASLEGVVRLLQLFSNKKSRNFALNLHAGAGITSLRNPSLIDYREKVGIVSNTFLIKEQDDMGHIIVGITPQYHLNSRLSINLDISQFTQFKQDFTYDSHNSIDSKSITGIVSVTAGLTIRF